ncbi:MAG: serine/threonine protein kinase [Myxococcales bacterium]|nr:serine/threonine protein kinase [Myxococcales bacterium]
MASDERAELRGTILEGRYRVGACIGVGGTGVVFEATPLGPNREDRPLVVKTLRPVFAYNADLVRRLRREGEVARRVAHPAIVPVLDEGLLPDGSPYLVLERIGGESMNRLLRRVGILDVPSTLAIVRRVCDVLHRAHAFGYVHRDVKPEHIVLDRSPDGELVVRLLDFGVCAAETAPTDERERERGRVFGTPSYVSPEQASGDPDVDARADIFGLGVVVYEALAGRLPFTGSTVTNLLRRIIREDAPRVGLNAPAVPEGVDALVARMLARRREDRIPSARALSRAIAPMLASPREIERRLAASLRHGRGLDMATTTVHHDAA